MPKYAQLKVLYSKVSSLRYFSMQKTWKKDTERWLLIDDQNFINLSCPKHPKIINWNKKYNFYFHTSLWCLRNILSFWGTKKCENKKNYVIFPVIPLGEQRLGLYFVKLSTYAIFVSPVIEIHKNNTDTFRVTNKEYYKIILF